MPDTEPSAVTAPAADTDPLTGTPFEDYDSVGTRVYEAIRNGVSKIAARQSGAAGFVAKPLYDGDPWPTMTPLPEAELQALTSLRSGVEASIPTAAARCRGRGKSWDEIGQILGFKDDDRHRRGELAWMAVVPQNDSYWGLTRPSLTYTCKSCTRTIHDYGPFEQHPDDNERGHADDCAIYQAALSAWKDKHGS
jgi:hypothetical protein